MIHKPKYLNTGPSVILDVVRFLAALTVAIGHLSQGYFTVGWPPFLMNLAVGSVSVFFVLSGFMIRYITSVKYDDLRSYMVDRFARIYSVAIPAIVLTILFDTLSAHFNYHYYSSNFINAVAQASGRHDIVHSFVSQTWFRGLIRIALSLTMLSQSWFQDISPLSNSPFWSLSYECVYYALFGIAVYLKGKKRLLGLVIIFMLTGPTVFLMLPLWLLGCVAYDAYHDGLFRKHSLLKLGTFSLLSLAGVHGSRALVDHLHIGWLNVRRIEPCMDIVAIVTVALLLPICIVARDIHISKESLAARMIHRLAAATFPLYLIHFPLYVFLAAVIPYNRASIWAKVVLLASALVLNIALSGPCDLLKNYLRSALLAPKKTVVPQKPAAAASSGTATL